MPPIDPHFEIVPGSIAHTTIQHGGQLPKPPIMVVMFDISYSMDERDATLHGRTVSRYEAGVAQLKELQAKHPGQIAIIAFGDEATVCPGGVPPEPNGWTMLYLALEKAREADTGAMKFVIISDGLPQQGDLAKREAEQFSVPIDVIYVGRDERGEEFMRDFAHGTGGTFYTDTSTMLLTATISKLLTDSAGSIVVE